MAKSTKIISLFIILAVIGLAVFYVVKKNPTNNQDVVILQVPFSPQAPGQNWSRNEDCEETSIAMANAFLNGNTNDRLSEEAAQSAINYLKAWEQANLGYNKDTGANATTQMAKGAFNLNVKQISNFTAEDLKSELKNNYPILLPINAKLLGSPQYLNDGPTYHMVVIRGYRGDKFIINDPGTNNGDGNEYSFSILQKAAADWNNETKTMDTSKKTALVIYK